MAFSVCTENPIENVKSYGLKRYLIKLLYAETLSDKQWTGSTNRNRISLENVPPT